MVINEFEERIGQPMLGDEALVRIVGSGGMAIVESEYRLSLP